MSEKPINSEWLRKQFAEANSDYALMSRCPVCSGRGKKPNCFSKVKMTANIDSIENPIERSIALALSSAGVRFEHDSSGKTKGLDFYLPDYNLYIECKAFGTPRTEEQLKRSENIIVVQGKTSASFIAMLLENCNEEIFRRE